MNASFEAFLLYYTAFHEGELSVKELKEMLLAEIGEEAFKEALAIFLQKHEERMAAGDNRTLYDTMKKSGD